MKIFLSLLLSTTAAFAGSGGLGAGGGINFPQGAGSSANAVTNSSVYTTTLNPTNAVGVLLYGSGVNLDGVYLFSRPNYTVTNPVVQTANNDFFYATKAGSTNIVGFNIPFAGNSSIASSTNTGGFGNVFFSFQGNDMTTNKWYVQNQLTFVANVPRIAWITTNTGVAASVQGQIFANSPLNLVKGGTVDANLFGNGSGISTLNYNSLANPTVCTNDIFTVSWLADSFGAGFLASSTYEQIVTGLINSNRIALGKSVVFSASANNSGYPAYYYATNFVNANFGYTLIGIEAGINDLRYGLTNYGVTPDIALMNSRSNLIKQAKGNSVPKLIVMMTIPTWCPYSQYTNATGATVWPGGPTIVNNNGFSYQQYQQYVYNVNQWCFAQRTNGVIVVDINDPAMPYMLADGLHPSDYGHANMAFNIWNAMLTRDTKVQPSTVVQQLYATNTLQLTSTGVTNNTQDTYLFVVTAGTGLSLKDPGGVQFNVPILNMPIPLKPGWRFTGTAVTASDAIILNR